MARFDDKVGIVTGAGGGIGQAYAEALAREGAGVVVADINTDGADAVTLAVGTGWTIVGAAAVAATTSAHFRARKTADGAWTAYRI